MTIDGVEVTMGESMCLLTLQPTKDCQHCKAVHEEWERNGRPTYRVTSVNHADKVITLDRE